jgi:hypothetical protein
MNPVKELFEKFIKVKRNPNGANLHGLEQCVLAPVSETEFPDADLIIFVTAEYSNSAYAMWAGRCEMDRGSLRPNAG